MAFIRRLISALEYLWLGQPALARLEPERFEKLSAPLMVIGIAWGLALVGLWILVSDLTSAWAYKLRFPAILPAMACGLAIVFGIFRQGGIWLAGRATTRAPWLNLPCRVTLAVLVAFALDGGAYTKPIGTALPDYLAWLCPAAILRVLFLGGLWGIWAIVVLGQFHRPGDATPPQTRHQMATAAPLTSAIALVFPLAGTLVYLSFLHPWHFVPPAAAIAAALGGGTLIIRLHHGICRQTLLASAMLTQLVFLAAYLLVK